MNSKEERIIAIVLVITIAASLAYCMFFLCDKVYTGEDFGIEAYKSPYDTDGDGLDDQSDILASARAYLATNPQYKSKYYEGGYPDDNFGVCTDVVAFALRGAGFDLMELLDADIALAPGEYTIEKADKNIDFRRVVNLRVFFERNAISLTTDTKAIDQWQGGDIVVWEHHVGIVSDRRTRRGVAYVLHNGSPEQKEYEENLLGSAVGAVDQNMVGHYRIDASLLNESLDTPANND